MEVLSQSERRPYTKVPVICTKLYRTRSRDRQKLGQKRKGRLLLKPYRDKHEIKAKERRLDEKMGDVEERRNLGCEEVDVVADEKEKETKRRKQIKEGDQIGQARHLSTNIHH